ncbi:MAG: hypothetical protein QOJ75_1950 [Chloroflexota bacterium]|nr:hypothetical protein [Chloroflexota bacterium]
MTWLPAGRDSHDIDALVTDRYLETLLTAHARGADTGPTTTEADPILRMIMVRLARDLPRFHPSFRFEEALADRLADAAVRMRNASHDATPEESAPVGPTLTILPDGSVRLARSADLRAPIGRPLLIGGALTSAALSLAGAYLAWRLKRPSSSPMARAVRAVARTRLA